MILIRNMQGEDGNLMECEECGDLYIQTDNEVDVCPTCEWRLS